MTKAITILSDPDLLQEGLRLGGVGVWRWKIGSDELRWTNNLEAVHRLEPGTFDGRLSSFQTDLHPEDSAQVWQQIGESTETGAPYRTVYRTAPRESGDELWIETSGGVVTGADGERFLTGVCLDVTDRVRGEAELERRLLQQRAVARFGSFALSENDIQRVLDEAVRVAAEVLRVPLTKVLQFADSADHLLLRSGLGWDEGLVGQASVGIERESQAGYTLLSDGPVIVHDLTTETRFDGPRLLHDHQVRSGISVTIPGAEARPFGVFGIHSRDVRSFDETDAEFLQSLANIVAGAGRQVAAADQKMLLVREMAHRAGNMLQLVNSIASQTFSAESDPQRARSAFSDRLNSLARANYVVARGGWTSTRFADLVQETLKPFGDRIIAQGRDVLLPPELCFDMGLVLHEVATNSMKYGTLGRDEGAVSVTWSNSQRSEAADIFRFTWDDTLPAEPNPARGSGFGSKLIRAIVEQKWNGRLAVENQSGFRLSLDIPVSRSAAEL